MPFGNSLIEFRPKSGCFASRLDGAGNRISRGLSQQARGPTSSPHAGLGASDAVSGDAVSRAARKARRRSQIPADFPGTTEFPKGVRPHRRLRFRARSAANRVEARLEVLRTEELLARTTAPAQPTTDAAASVRESSHSPSLTGISRCSRVGFERTAGSDRREVQI
jgi:hypothetical protein